jgi:2,4-dienoyl-CoA reductase (NADPH2)
LFKNGEEEMLAKRLTKLFEPIKIGNIELKNRIKLPAMGIAMGEGDVTEQAKAFYAARAKGGAALIGISCTPTRLIQGPLFGIFDDRFIPGLRELVEVIHANDAKVYAQMGTGYSWAFGTGPVEYISPSGITPTGRPGSAFRVGGPFEPTMPGALSINEIHQMVDAYGDGALRAQQAGFDAVEVIASVSYTISQFLSPLTNRRTDQYGGSLENRMRFLLEIIENIKSKTGEAYPITCRLSGADLMEPMGYDLEDTKEMARILEKAGVAEIDVMSGWHYASVPIIQTPVPQGAWVYLAEGVKSAVNIPVAAGTQIQDPLVAERVLVEGKADMVYIARALIADADLPNKAREGQLADIRPCMNCCRCISAVDNPPVFCSVNARVGREAEYPSDKPAASSKSVLVVGAGPGGMEAACIASIRGHKVTLCDQNPRLGGALLLASVTNRRMEPVLNYMKRQIEKLPIKIKLNTQVTPALVEEMKPEVVVLALGGAASSLEVSGSSGNIVLDRNDVQAIFGGHASKKGSYLRRFVSYLGALFIRYFYKPSVIRWLLRFNWPFKKCVVVVGGNFAGCELAETLVDRGKEVTIIEESGRLGSDIELTHRWVFLDKLRKAGAKMLKEAKVVKITNKGVEIMHAGSTDFTEADTVVNVGITTNTGLAQELEGRVPELHLVGDCAEPGKLMEAIASGFHAGQRI